MLLVGGDFARRTGGNLYDRRIARACRRAGVPLQVISAASTPRARAAVVRVEPRVIVIDSIAIPSAAPMLRWMRSDLGARVIALMHMSTRARGTREVLRTADRVVAVSADLAREFATMGVPRSRLSVIPPGSDGIPRVPRAQHRGDRLRILAVANWARSKGIATLVAATADVPGVRLDLVGDTGTGAYRDAIVARIRSSGLTQRVVVHGALGERALARRYAAADAFALPTLREGYGTVFAEALARGLPVIAADIAVVRSIVGDAGLFVPPGRVRPVASAMRLMTDEWLRGRLASAARMRARALPLWAGSERAFAALVADEMRAAVARS